jgi:hypothetical protein
VTSLTIVDQAASVGTDVHGKLLGSTGEFAQIGVLHLQCVHVVQEEFDCLSGSILVAVPEQPLDTFQFGQQTFAGRIVMLGDSAGVLTQHRDAHGDVEPIEHVFSAVGQEVTSWFACRPWLLNRSNRRRLGLES